MKILAALAAAVAGATTGLATVALHGLWWGLLLGIAATAVTTYALPAGWWGRLAFVVGWDAMVAWLLVPRAEGDYLISSDPSGYVVLGLGLVLVVVGIATLPRPRRGASGRLPTGS